MEEQDMRANQAAQDTSVNTNEDANHESIEIETTEVTIEVTDDASLPTSSDDTDSNDSNTDSNSTNSSNISSSSEPSAPLSPSRPKNTFDVFHWANEIDEVKNNVSVELFLFNKNYTPYRVRYSEQLTASVKALFMQEATGYIIKEADKGLECREYEKSDGEDKVIYRTNLSNVGRAETLIHLIEHEYRNIDSMSDHLDEFKKIKGIIARFTYPGNEGGTKVFYIAKAISASSAP